MLSRNSARPVIDSAAIAVLLVAANLVFGADDRGWFQLNPSPYLLLPLLIGGKYGLRAGLGAGVAGLVLCVGLALASGRELMETLGSAPLLLLGLPVAGLLSGELHRQAAGRRSALEVENERIGQMNDVLTKELEVSREAQHVLQKELALHGADVCSLDLELRKIFEEGAPPALRGALSALSDVSGLTDAAFYLLAGAGDVLERAEFLGDSAYFPQEIGSKHTKMAWTAIEAGELVTCRGLGEGRGDVGKARFLAAVPWRRYGKVTGVLLVHDMPFLSMNWQTLARIELVCDWVAAMQDMRERAGDESHALADFRALVGLAGRTLEEQGLPSAIALITAVGALSASELREAIGDQLRPSDVAVAVEDRGLAVLMPMEAGRDAEVSAARYLESVHAHTGKASVKLWTLEEPIGAEELWKEMVSSVGA